MQDLAIRFIAPAMAAEKLGIHIDEVLDRRHELGLGDFIARKVYKAPTQPQPASENQSSPQKNSSSRKSQQKKSTKKPAPQQKQALKKSAKKKVARQKRK